MKKLGLVAIFLSAMPGIAAEFPAVVVLKLGTAQTSTVQAKLGELVTQVLPEYLPGHPKITLEFVEGGTGVLLARQMVETEPKDGSMLGGLTLVANRGYVLDPDGMGFDPRGIRWVGALARSTWVCSVGLDAPFTPGETPLVFAGMTKRDGTYVLPKVLGEVLSPGKVEVVIGFKGVLETYAAFDRGEVNALCNTDSTFRRDKRGEVQRIVASFGTFEGAAPDVVNVLERLSALDKAAIAIASPVNQPFNTFALPSGTPDEIVALYRDAFARMQADPAFADKAKALLPEFAEVSGESLQTFVDGLSLAPAAVIARARAMQQ